MSVSEVSPGTVDRGHIRVALYNYKDGGLNKKKGSYNFEPLQHAFSVLREAPPDIIIICEAKKWRQDNRSPFLAATAALSEELHRTYDGEVGWLNRGDFPPAVLYNTERLEMLYWGNREDPDDERNLARFRLHGGREEDTLLASAQHWDPGSGDIRLEQARRLVSDGRRKEPMLIAGDLNSIPSGPHFFDPDNWEDLPLDKRMEKGRELADGSLVPDTRAIDRLTGRWDEQSQSRLEGLGFILVPELAFATGTSREEAFKPTATGSRMPIDLFVANRSLAERYVPGSYHVYPPEGDPPPSDHSLVVVSFDFRQRTRT